MAEHVCPWWMAYTFDNPLRGLFHKPEKMLHPFVKQGMTVADIGCGMGFFSIGMARMVGPDGRVLSVDLQQKMLDVMRARARRAGVEPLIKPILCEKDHIRVDEPVDFALTFWMVHEIPDTTGFLKQIREILRPNGKLFIAEPRFHVSQSNFDRILDCAVEAGLKMEGEPKARFSRTALLGVD